MIHHGHVLALLRVPFDDSIVASTMILALLDSYSTLRSILTSNFDKPKIDKVKNTILAEECTQSTQSSLQATELKAHMKGKPQQQGKGKGKGISLRA